MLVALVAFLLDAALPPPAANCIALINLEAGNHLVVPIGATSVDVGTGWIAYDGSHLWSLFSIEHDVTKRGPHGSVSSRWNELFAQPWPDGVPVRLEGDDPQLEPPGPDDVGTDWDREEHATITSIIGPFVSVSLGASGFTGGAHELDEASATIRDLRRDERLSLVAVIGGAAAKPFAAVVGEAAKDYVDGGGEGAKPSFDADTRAVLEFDGDKLVARATLDCCQWFENHNQVAVSAELPAMPKALVAYGTLVDGTFVAPNRCGSVRLTADGVIVTPKGGARMTVPLSSGFKPTKPIGVTWLTRPLPAAQRLVDAQRSWADPTDDLAAAVQATKDKDYSTAIERFHDVLAVEPLNARAAAGLGHALYLAKDYRASVAASRLALACDPDAAQRGAIGYNIGMALEALGDKAGARAAYTDSIAARPNATVQKRLDALD